VTWPRQPIRRMRGPKDAPRYWHPYGYSIRRARRDWRWERGAAGWTPSVWWEVRRDGEASALLTRFDANTLREARAWCDRHPWRPWHLEELGLEEPPPYDS
jgi:hypothetical protein